MSYRKVNIFLLIVILIINLSGLQAQTVKELERQRKQTLQMLESTNKMLNETKKSQKSSINKLSILNKNINERKKLIKNISSEINQLDTEMGRLSNESRVLNNKLKVLKNDYAKLVQEEHVNRSIYNKIMFVLSAKTFDQSYRRLRYLQEFTSYRKEQVYEIENIRNQILQKNDSLNQHKTTKVKVVQQKEVEAKKLTTDQTKEKSVLNGLKKKESQLRTNLKKQQKKADDLNKKIERLIAEEIRKAEEKRRAEAKKSGSKETKTDSKSSSSGVYALTKEEKLISGNFAANKGRLPWPTSNGYISGHYGIQPHPVLKHVTTNNKGIYIQTPAGSNCRAVFEGTVTQRFSIPGSNNAVIIQHGEYRTVYANLTSIYVNVGDKVSAKQAIGKIYTDSENDNKTELYFQIWKGRTLQNPESWITK
ncbi:MAG: peptidoglycan DD-metalloendopeptidase family protein [Paludibacter sp.]|nr:peptidoglycan DD-metalloendopeptidase family protein [Paludibacter sp.]